MPKYIIYADGACSNNQDENIRVGAYAAAIFTQFNGKPYKKDVNGTVNGATNNQMELQAVIEALRSIRQTDPDAMPEVEVRCDSQYVVKGASEWLSNWKANNWLTKAKDPIKNREMWEEFDKLVAQFRCTFNKVRGDGNDKWNSYCDKTARGLCGSKPKRR